MFRNGGRTIKKLLAITLVCILLLSGCARTLDDVIQNEPSIVGVVIEEYTNLIRIADADGMEYYVRHGVCHHAANSCRPERK